MRIRTSGGVFLLTALCLGGIAPSAAQDQVSNKTSVRSTQDIPRPATRAPSRFRAERPDSSPARAVDRPTDRSFAPAPRPSDTSQVRDQQDRSWRRDGDRSQDNQDNQDNHSNDNRRNATRPDRPISRPVDQYRSPGPVYRTHVWAGPRHYFRPGPTRYFGSSDRYMWRSGRWDHGYRDGRLGWWWGTAGVWYWYADPIYPYPDTVSTFYYYDSTPIVYAPPQVILDSPDSLGDQYYCGVPGWLLSGRADLSGALCLGAVGSMNAGR